MLAIGCGLELFPLLCGNASQFHQGSGLKLAAMKSKSIQLLDYTSAAGRCFRFLVNGTNPENRLGSLLLPGRFGNLISLFRDQFAGPFLEFVCEFSACCFFHVNTS